MIKEYLLGIWTEADDRNRQAIISLVGQDVDTLLDCGCDDGAFTDRVARVSGASRALGLEIDEEKAEKARVRGIEVTETDLNERLPLDDRTVDAVIANQLIEHIHETDNLLSEIWRILKPGGHAVISTENLASWHNIFSLVFGWQPFSLTNISEHRSGVGNPLALLRGESGTPKYLQHFRLFTVRGLVEIVETHGFKVVQLSGSGYFPLGGRVAEALNRLDVRHSAFITARAHKPR